MNEYNLDELTLGVVVDNLEPMMEVLDYQPTNTEEYGPTRFNWKQPSN